MAQAGPHLFMDKGDDAGTVAQVYDKSTSAGTAQPPGGASSPSSDSGNNGTADGGVHGPAEYIAGYGGAENESVANEVLAEEARSKGTWFAYVKTKQFWVVLVLGQGKSYYTLSHPYPR